jgi:3-oxoacyl-[acyl-carrier protein] reductase
VSRIAGRIAIVVGAKARADELGEPHAAVEVEVTDEASVQRLFDDVVAREGRLDVVVNCAASATSV